MNKGLIYKLTSPNNKIYIGQTINLNLRLSYYRRLACQFQPKLFRSIRKYGFDLFKIEILLDNIEEDKLDEMEIFYIEKYNSYLGKNGLNSTVGGSRPPSQKNKHYPKSKETRLKMSIAALKRTSSQKGKLWSKERREIYEKNKGKPTSKKGKPWSEKRRAAQQKA